MTTQIKIFSTEFYGEGAGSSIELEVNQWLRGEGKDKAIQSVQCNTTDDKYFVTIVYSNNH